MANSQVPVESPDVKIQTALLEMFSSKPDIKNPHSRNTATLSRDALKSMYIYKITPKFKMPGDHVASHPPLVIYVAVYIPYPNTRMTLPLSQFLHEVVSHC